MFKFFRKSHILSQVPSGSSNAVPVEALSKPKVPNPFFRVETPKFSEINTFDVRLKQFKDAYSSGISAKMKFYHATLTREIDPYKTIQVPKANGETRYLSNPARELSGYASWFLREHLNEPQLYHENAYAYLLGKSAVQCSKQHQNAVWIIKMDIKDFFHGIDERMVFWAFQNAGANRYRAFYLARLLTRLVSEPVDWLPEKYKGSAPAKKGSRFRRNPNKLGFLPQGMPTSGAISNLVCYPLDVRFSEFAKRNNLTYTRYADDIVLSSRDEFDRGKAERLLHSSIRLLEKFGFQHNSRKTKIIPPGARKLVLGVVVGEGRIRLTKQVRTNIDQMIWALNKYGLEKHAAHTSAQSPGFLINRLTGKLLWALEVDRGWAQPRIDKMQGILNSSLAIGSIDGFEFAELQTFQTLRKGLLSIAAKSQWKLLVVNVYLDAIQMQVRIDGEYRFLHLQKSGRSNTWVGTWEARWVSRLAWTSGSYTEAFKVKISKADDQIQARTKILTHIQACLDYEVKKTTVANYL